MDSLILFSTECATPLLSGWTDVVFPALNRARERCWLVDSLWGQVSRNDPFRALTPLFPFYNLFIYADRNGIGSASASGTVRATIIVTNTASNFAYSIVTIHSELT